MTAPENTGWSAAGEDGDRLGPQRLAREAVRHGRLVEPADDQVDLARREQRQQVLGAALLEPNPEVRIARLEPGEHARQHARGRHRQGAERHGAAAGAGEPVELLVEPAQLGEDAAGGADEHQPGLGRADAAGVTVEQPDLEQVLELVQALGQGRLADPEHGRRLEQTAVRVHGVHRPEEGQPEALVEVTARHPAASRSRPDASSSARSTRSSRSRRNCSSANPAPNSRQTASVGRGLVSSRRRISSSADR